MTRRFQTATGVATFRIDKRRWASWPLYAGSGAPSQPDRSLPTDHGSIKDVSTPFVPSLRYDASDKPVLLADLDLKVTGQFVVDHTTVVIANAAGQLDGVIVYFELELGPTIRLSTHPSQADENCSWRSPVWVFGDPLCLRPGNRFAVTYRYRVPEAQEGVSVTRL